MRAGRTTGRLESVARAKIFVSAEDGPELLDAVESWADPEVLCEVEIGVVYLQGNPRRPETHWMRALDRTADIVPALEQLKAIKKSLADEQLTKALELIQRVSAIFRERIRRRSVATSKRFGYGSLPPVQGEAVTDEMIESSFDYIVACYEKIAQDGKPRSG